MKRGEILALGVACVLRDQGRPKEEWWGSFETIAAATSYEVEALRVLRDAGFDLAAAIDIFAEHERLVEKHPPNDRSIYDPLHRPLYARQPRTKKYGPAQDPDSYFSAEKLRVYNYGAVFVDRSPTARLPEADWLPMVGAVFRRDNFICTYCGADGDEYKLHCDHIAPVSRGGPNDLENLTTACDFCNCSKRDALPHEWRPLRGVAQ